MDRATTDSGERFVPGKNIAFGKRMFRIVDAAWDAENQQALIKYDELGVDAASYYECVAFGMSIQEQREAVFNDVLRNRA